MQFLQWKYRVTTLRYTTIARPIPVHREYQLDEVLLGWGEDYGVLEVQGRLGVAQVGPQPKPAKYSNKRKLMSDDERQGEPPEGK